MIQIIAYVNEEGKSPFMKWSRGLDNNAVLATGKALEKMRSGLKKNIKQLGDNFFEYRINRHGALRIYFGTDNEKRIILLGGGNKHTQSSDIHAAKKNWQNYLKNERTR